MLKKLLGGILVLSLFVFTASTALATDVSMKIGIVDLKKAVTESEQGKTAKGEFEALMKGRQGAIDEMGKNIQKLKSDLDSQGDIISNDAKRKKEDELERLAREYQRTAGDFQSEVSKRESELIQGIVVGLKKIINIMAEEDKYTLILEKNEAIVLFADKASDITEKVIKRFDESQQKNIKK